MPKILSWKRSTKLSRVWFGNVLWHSESRLTPRLRDFCVIIFGRHMNFRIISYWLSAAKGIDWLVTSQFTQSNWAFNAGLEDWKSRTEYYSLNNIQSFDAKRWLSILGHLNIVDAWSFWTKEKSALLEKCSSEIRNPNKSGSDWIWAIQLCDSLQDGRRIVRELNGLSSKVGSKRFMKAVRPSEHEPDQNLRTHSDEYRMFPANRMIRWGFRMQSTYGRLYMRFIRRNSCEGLSRT